MNKLFGCYLALLFWAPLPLGSNRPWSEMLLAALVFLLLGSWAVLKLKSSATLTRATRKSYLALGLLALAQLFVGYQFFTRDTLDLGGTQLALLSGLAYSGLFFLTLELVSNQRRIRLLIYTLVASGVCQALYGSVMVLTGIEYSFLIPKDTYLGVATGTYINRNHLAGYLELCLSAGLGLLISQLSSHAAHNLREVLRRLVNALISQKILLRICLVIMVIALVLTHSRMGNTAFFTSMTIGGLLLLLSKRTHNRKTLFALLLSLVVIDIVVVGAYFGVDKLVDRLENTSALSETRDEVNSYTLELVEQNLLTGTGAGSFYTAFPAVRDKDVGSIFYSHAHNDYLEFLSERGIIGIAPLIAFILLSLVVALRALYTRRNPLMRGCALGSVMAMISFGMHSTVDFNLQIPANAATFIVLLALGWIAAFHRSEKRSSSSNKPSTIAQSA